MVRSRFARYLWFSLALPACGRAENESEHESAAGSVASGGANTAGAANSGGSSGVSGNSNGAVFEESSWDMELSISLLKPAVRASCAHAKFALRLIPNGDGFDVISGRDGGVFGGRLARTTNATATSMPLSPLWFSTLGEGCSFESFKATELTLEGLDQDNDRRIDAIVGVGRGEAFVVDGDVASLVQLTFSVSAVPDVTPPSLLVPASVHPLDSIIMNVTEPVTLTSKVSISTKQGSVELVPFDAALPAIGRFSADQVLPFSTQWSVSATGGDLAGHAFQPVAVAISMLDDPGVFAQDGFETPPVAAFVGDARLVAKVGTLPALSGAKSLFLPPNTSATFHLERPSTATTLRLTAQPLIPDGGFDDGLSVEAGIIGGHARARVPLVGPSEATTPTGDAEWASAGMKQELSATLIDSGSELVVRLATRGDCSGFCPPPAAYLIDDLRVE